MPTLNYCVGPQPGRPFKCLTCGSTEKDPRQGSPLRAEGAELCRKTGWKGLLTASYQGLEKRLSEGRNSCRGGSPCPCTLGAARVAASQAALPPSRPTLTGAELPRQKKVLCLCAQVCFGRVQLFSMLWTVACQTSLSGGSPGKNTGVYWPILVAIPF